MYSNSYGYSSPSLSNNPFIEDPTHARNRYPDISSPASVSPPSYQSWTSPSQSPLYGSQFQPQQAQYGQVPQMTGYQPQQQQQQQQPAGGNFQPSSSFGQQLVGQLNASYTGYQQPPQYTGYSGQQQPYGGYSQQPQGPSYRDVAQFDPYGALSQVWDPTQQSQQSQTTQPLPVGSTNSSAPPPGQPHPRDYIRTHKIELESWDQYAWKQLLNAFDALKDTWGARRNEVTARLGSLQGGGYGGGYGGTTNGYGGYGSAVYGEAERLQGLLREANSNFDSIAASSFQILEARQGYRQSADPSSKRRVRESCNAALQSLPDWPPQS